MPDRTIGSLPVLSNVTDNTKIPVEEAAVAYQTNGQQWTRYLHAAVAGDLAAAAQSADRADTNATRAANNATAAANSASQAVAARQAIENLGVAATTLPDSGMATVLKTVGAGGIVTLTFGIPKGEKGDEGPQGPRGNTGPEGPPGGLAQVTPANGTIFFNIGPGTNPRTGQTENGHLLMTYVGDTIPAGEEPYYIDYDETHLDTYGHLMWRVD